MILSAALLGAGCSAYLAPGGPAVPVMDPPPLPELQEGICQSEEDRAAFLGWLREMIGRSYANWCALKALNGDAPQECQK